ncbi:MAG TPA: hypothetical protein VK369_10165, partial [Segetibacter sp.]|nr:hypothetical protein [Segetibacter sp.]
IRLYLLEKDKGYFFYYDHINKVRVCFFERGNFQSGRVRDNFSVQGTFKLGNQLFYQHKSSEAYLYQNINYAEKVKIQGLPPLLDEIFRQKKYTFISTSSGTFLYADGRLFEYTRSNSGITATLLFERLPCEGVTGIRKEKRTGNIIISTLSEGFYVIKRKDFAVINLATNVNRKDGGKYLNNNIVYAIEKLDGQRIFTYGYFLQEDGSEAALASQKFDPARFNPYFLYKRDRDHIWLQFNEWVEELNTKTLQVKRMVHVIDAKKVIKLTDTSQILLSSKKIVLLKDSSHEILYENDTSSFLSLERINNDTLAIGGHKGLFYYSLAKKSFQRVSGTETFTVRFLFKDRNSRLWFTTYGQGLFSVSGATVKQISSDKAGYLNTGHCILQDKQNDFWVSTNHGLFNIEYNSLLANLTNANSTLRYIYFDKYDGFKTNEFNGGCYPSGLYDSTSGFMYFPSMNGIVKFNPDLIQNPESSKQIVIDDVVINDSVHLKLENQNFFKVDNKTASIRIDFSSPHFGNANNLKFYYSLDSQTEYWKEAGDLLSVSLNNLSGGTHTLRIKKEEGISEPVIHVISFEIEKKFTETTIFKLLVVASVFFVVYLLFQARIQQLTKERTRLEKEVSERTKDQAQLIKQLKHSISDLTQLQQELSQLISHKENVIAILIHDIKSPLNFLTSVANHLETDFETNSFEKNKEIIKEVTKSLNSLNLFTKDFTIWLNASNPGHIQKAERLNLQKIIDEALNIYKEIIAINNISVKQTNTDVPLYSDGPMVKAIIRNLIDNAVKNTENGTITIDVTHE